MTLSGAGLMRTDPDVNFNWGTAAPMPGINADGFSVRWTGRITPKTTGTYTFYADTDDGVRLWVDDKLLVDNWVTHAVTENSATVTLKAGTQYGIRMEYFEKTGSAVAKLLWSGPSVAKAIIPSSVLNRNSFGLVGEYYNASDLSGSVALIRPDGSVNFDWATGSPDSRINVDNFSARWAGYVVVPTTGTYVFYTDADDGVRLWVNGAALIDDWNDHSATENSGKVTLTAGTWYPIKMEYYEHAGSASAKLLWSGPNTAKAIVPESALRDH